MAGTAPAVHTASRPAGVRPSGKPAASISACSGPRSSETLDLASFNIGAVATLRIADERGQQVAWHEDIVRRLAIVELRLAEEAAAFTCDLENPPHFDPFAGERSAASRLVGGALLVGDGPALAGRAVAAARTPSLAVSAASATAAAPATATAACAAAPILGITRFPGAVLTGTSRFLGTLAIRRLGGGGGARDPLTRATTTALRINRSGTGGPAVIPSMIVSQG